MKAYITVFGGGLAGMLRFPIISGIAVDKPPGRTSRYFYIPGAFRMRGVLDFGRRSDILFLSEANADTRLKGFYTV
jgi:hypothetical protein